MRRRYDVVECAVTGHVHYGLLIAAEDGERGFVDRAEITDEPGEPWPETGSRLRGVVLGYTRDGRLRVATRPGYVELVATADDPAAGAADWSRLRDVRRTTSGRDGGCGRA
ncbi:hypothetical protein ACIOD2_09885 [Amycolatopsis sp. NPDC088138]|uniref:hypothetical protein n=1 Tax=Amycolatopsis sp. NPDC088138 TaxID=3363938 RepID=UPI003816F4C8